MGAEKAGAVLDIGGGFADVAGLSVWHHRIEADIAWERAVNAGIEPMQLGRGQEPLRVHGVDGVGDKQGLMLTPLVLWADIAKDCGWHYGSLWLAVLR